MRPRSLAEVAALVLQGESFDLSLHNFLDEFYARPNPEALEVEPIRLRDADPALGAIKDAYLAATAESLAYGANFPAPHWVFAADRILRRPWFALPWASLRAVLLLESPAPFRARNLFVSANALTRV